MIIIINIIYIYRIENIDIVFGGHSRGQLETWAINDVHIGFRSTPWCTHLTKVF